MANPNVKPRLIKGDPKTREIARSGGKAKKGSISIKAAMKRALENGSINVDDLAQAFLLHAKEGNAPYAKLALEYLDGRVKEQVELTGENGGPIVTKTLSKKEYQKARSEMLKEEDV